MERIERAIISVWDKAGLDRLAKGISKNGIEIYSTGGTYRYLKNIGVDATKIEDFTGFPEVMNGRVKTLNPMIFAGILGDVEKKAHIDDLKKINTVSFQLVVVNLYPFEEALRKGANHEEMIEMIDIGGPSLLRAAAKNYRHVVVLSDTSQYDEFLERLETGSIDLDYRKRLSASVFWKTANYDSIIYDYLEGEESLLPEKKIFAIVIDKKLRYGENPDQNAAFYKRVDNRNGDPFQVLHGKELSYNNYIDCLAAFDIVKGFNHTCCVIIKHTNPCGFGTVDFQVESYKRAVKTDPVSYFGGIVGFNTIVEKETAEELVKSFLECIVAPGFMDDALEILKQKKNLRLVIPNKKFFDSDIEIKSYGAGFLLQEGQSDDPGGWNVVTEIEPDDDFMRALHIGWHLVRFVKSNAVVIADNDGSVGIGAGQMSRIDALKIAIRKAQEANLKIEGSILASDAFFPFRDSIDLASQYGIKGVIQPGGSVRDNEVINACNEHKMFMIFTGKRVFKH